MAGSASQLVLLLPTPAIHNRLRNQVPRGAIGNVGGPTFIGLPPITSACQTQTSITAAKNANDDVLPPVWLVKGLTGAGAQAPGKQRACIPLSRDHADTVVAHEASAKRPHFETIMNSSVTLRTISGNGG